MLFCCISVILFLYCRDKTLQVSRSSSPEIWSRPSHRLIPSRCSPVSHYTSVYLYTSFPLLRRRLALFLQAARQSLSCIPSCSSFRGFGLFWYKLFSPEHWIILQTAFSPCVLDYTWSDSLLRIYQIILCPLCCVNPQPYWTLFDFFVCRTVNALTITCVWFERHCLRAVRLDPTWPVTLAGLIISLGHNSATLKARDKPHSKNLLTEIDESRLAHSLDSLWCMYGVVPGEVPILRMKDIWIVKQKTKQNHTHTLYWLSDSCELQHGHIGIAEVSLSDWAVSTVVRETLLIYMCIRTREQWLTLSEEVNDLRHAVEEAINGARLVLMR